MAPFPLEIMAGSTTELGMDRQFFRQVEVVGPPKMAAVKRLSSGNMIVRSTIFYIHIIYIYTCVLGCPWYLVNGL